MALLLMASGKRVRGRRQPQQKETERSAQDEGRGKSRDESGAVVTSPNFLQSFGYNDTGGVSEPGAVRGQREPGCKRVSPDTREGLDVRHGSPFRLGPITRGRLENFRPGSTGISCGFCREV